MYGVSLIHDYAQMVFPRMSKILILGIGNILQKDDGIGVHIVQEMIRSKVPLPDNVEIVDGGTAGYDLIPIMQGHDKIIIVDALKANDRPGAIYRFSAEHLADQSSSFSMHDIGIRGIIDSLRIMGENPFIEIIGIVPEDINTLDIGISDSVKESIQQAVEQILKAATC